MREYRGRFINIIKGEKNTVHCSKCCFYSKNNPDEYKCSVSNNITVIGHNNTDSNKLLLACKYGLNYCVEIHNKRKLKFYD